MYHCHEIPFKAYASFEALKSAVERYPFKGGRCPHLEETRLNWKPAAQWHEGQFSALYAYSSTGTVLPGLAAEVKACLYHSTTLIWVDGVVQCAR